VSPDFFAARRVDGTVVLYDDMEIAAEAQHRFDGNDIRAAIAPSQRVSGSCLAFRITRHRRRVQSARKTLFEFLCSTRLYSGKTRSWSVRIRVSLVNLLVRAAGRSIVDRPTRPAQFAIESACPV